MDDNPTTIEMLLEKAENYTKTSIELAKLKIIDKCAEIVSSFASFIAIAIVVVMFIALINFGIAIYVGQLFGNIAYGFFAVAGFYLIVILLLAMFKEKWLKLPVSNIIIDQIQKEKVR